MIKLDFIISNLLLLVKCLGFSDISKDINWLNIYTKSGRVLFSSGEKIRIIVDTLIDIETEIDVCVDCRKLIEYVNYLKGFEKEGACSLLITDTALKIINDTKSKIENKVSLEYLDKTTAKIRAKNFNKIATITPEIMKDGMGFVATGSVNSEKYSSQLAGVLIETKDKVFRLAGTDGVRCCIYNTECDQESNYSVVVPSHTARAISNVASVLNKNADVCYSSTYFVCDFGNVVIYSSKLTVDFPSLDGLFDFSGLTVSVNYNDFINILRGASIAGKEEQDNKIEIKLANNILLVSSTGFNASCETNNVIDDNKAVTVFMNVLFLYSLCSFFKSENLVLRLGDNAIKINDEENNKLAFLALLKV